MGGLVIPPTEESTLFGMLLSQGVPAALLCVFSLWLMARGMPAAAAFIERISLRHAALLERQAVQLSEQSQQLRNLAAQGERQLALLESIEGAIERMGNCTTPPVAPDYSIPATVRRRRSGR